ncbi:MAG: protease inhibitor I42 family protein [Smithellaceae bacterium]
MKIINYIYRIAKNKVVVSAAIVITVCWVLTFPAYAEKISLTESANLRNIKMSRGDNLEITLEGNPTTGYIWEKVEGDSAILFQQGNYKYIPAKPSLVGSGGKFVFTFRGAAAGRTKLHVIYHRTFEKNTAPVKTFEITVIVK